LRYKVSIFIWLEIEYLVKAWYHIWVYCY